MLFSQKPDFGYKRSPEEVNLQQWINVQIFIDLLKGGFLAFLTETRLRSQEERSPAEVNLQHGSMALPQWTC